MIHNDKINIGLLGKYPIVAIIFDWMNENETNNTGKRFLYLNKGSANAKRNSNLYVIGGVSPIEFHESKI